MGQCLNSLVSNLITIPWVKVPCQDLKHPQSSYSMKNAMNVQINFGPKDEHHIGAWFMQPTKDDLKSLPKTEDEQFVPLLPSSSEERLPLVGQNENIILYLHSISNSRAMEFRRQMCGEFQKMGCYVLAIDYRNFADSSKICCPTETSMVEDAEKAFDWIVSNVHPEANIFVWGHSIGTGVTCKVGEVLSSRNTLKPKGYILEAPFTSMKDLLESYKASCLLCCCNIGNLLTDSDMMFNNSLWLPKISEPVMILHSKDDEVIGFDLGEKLVNDTKGLKENVKLIPFEDRPSLKLRHNDMVKAIAEDSSVVVNFIQECSQSKFNV